MARRRQTHNNKSQEKSQEKSQNKSCSNENKDSGKVTESDKSTPVDGNEGKNDVAWYDNIPELLRDSANVPYSYPYGSPIKLEMHDNTTDTDFVPAIAADDDQLSEYAIGEPGIVTLFTKPAIGSNDGHINDPINVAANSLYSYLRINATGKKNYDPSDAMIYCLTWAEVYSFVFWCQRIFGYAFMYSQKNYYIAEQLLIAEGFDAQSLRNNLANFRYWLNSFINRVSSYALPGNIYYFHRRAFMYANYYTENSNGNIKDGLYQFSPDGFWVLGYNEGATDGSAGMPNLTIKKVDRSSLRDLTYLINYGEQMLHNIVGNEDMGIISSDIIRSFGTNLISIAAIPEDATILPVFDPFVLSQFKNATVLSLIDNTDSLASGNKYVYWEGPQVGTEEPVRLQGYYGCVYVNENGLITSRQRVKMAYALEDNICLYTLAACDKVLSVDTWEPQLGDTIEATRLMNIVDSEAQAPGCILCGSDVCVGVAVRYRKNGYSDGYESISWGFAALGISYNQSTMLDRHDLWCESSASTNNGRLSLFACLKYAPVIYKILYMTDVTEGNPFRIWGIAPIAQLENYTIINEASLRRMHECALLSLFFVPGIAKIV